MNITELKNEIRNLTREKINSLMESKEVASFAKAETEKYYDKLGVTADVRRYDALCKKSDKLREEIGSLERDLNGRCRENKGWGKYTYANFKNDYPKVVRLKELSHESQLNLTLVTSPKEVVALFKSIVAEIKSI